MKRFERYSHRNCLDMAIEVIKVQYAGPRYLKLRVNFVSRRTPAIVYWNDTPITIKREHLRNWSRL